MKENNKEHLEKIKNILEEITPTIDISDVYVYTLNGMNNIAKVIIKNTNNNVIETTLNDVFMEHFVYEKNIINSSCSLKNAIRECYNKPYIRPILEVEPSLKKYSDNKVPEDVLRQLYYKLNSVDSKENNRQK